MNDWVRIGMEDDVPLLEGRNVTIGDRRVAVFRLHDGSWAAIDAACPHAGGPLADGIVAGGCVTCPLHGLRIDLTTGEACGDATQRVRTYEVIVRDGALWLAGELAEAA